MPEIPDNWKDIAIKILKELRLDNYVESAEWNKLEVILSSCKFMQLECRAIELASKILVDIICEHVLPDGNKRFALIFIIVTVLPEIYNKISTDLQSFDNSIINNLLYIAQHCDNVDDIRRNVMKWLADLIS